MHACIIMPPRILWCRLNKNNDATSQWREQKTWLCSKTDEETITCTGINLCTARVDWCKKFIWGDQFLREIGTLLHDKSHFMGVVPLIISGNDFWKIFNTLCVRYFFCSNPSISKILHQPLNSWLEKTTYVQHILTQSELSVSQFPVSSWFP